ncbi:hypothetical protein CkaCkLH20_06642 [Colletotrichum karsti]|uniref:DUF6604 domain-containing protein n=1 Tax=Colletotrichum karsti TaxID=1095194 RepID=A0A9P6IBQ6_9PEZI|nr:uncharacterized protein CkaCkLH20_06642 [Colletotrichum karsti]KAF9875710.1 hypothetical protein CkaCkLH20_06642 [Colletotrichum karsti]
MVVQEQPKPTAQTMQPTQPQPNPNALSKEEREKEEKKSWSCLFFKQVEVMLPAPLLSTYQRYKQDTDIVASWLATTAKSCGYPTDLLSEVAARSAPSADPATGDTPRQPKAKDKGKTNGKGKKKKPAKKNDAAPAVPKRYTVAVKEFVPLAEFISTKKQAKVPDAFVSALNRVIALRAQFSAKLSEHGAKRNVVSDLKHNYFLGILDKVREVLRPRMTADGARASNEGLDHLSNRFAGLSVFEPSQAFLDAPDIEIPRPDPNVIYEAEAGDSTEDAIFFFQLLWRDLYDIRMCIRVLWRKYMEGYGINEVDLVAVAIATNTALDLARHMINDVFSEFKGREEVFYKTLKEQAILTHYREQANPENSYFGLTKNPDAAELKHNAGSWSFVNAYNMLAEILPALSTEGEPIGPILPRNEADEPGMENSWYAAHHGHLKAMLEDLLVVIKSVQDWPVEDNLLRGFKEALETRKIPFHFVFSAQLHLDIIWRFGLDVGSTHLIDQFLNKMRAMKDLVQDYIAINTELGTLESMGPYDMNARQVGKDSQRMLDDPIFEARLQEVPKKSRAQAKAKLEKHRLLKRNPVLCGLITYRHMMLLYKDGIALANATRSIVAAYHLYHAVTRE